MTSDDADGGFPTDSVGTADIQYRLDTDTYDRLRTAYWRARRRGYSGGFPLFVHNHCSVGEETVVVDGERVEADVEAEIEAWLDLDDGETDQ